MFGIGPTELFVVAALALMLFSPRELPKMLRSVLKFWGSIKRTADDFKDTIMQEEALQDLREVYKGGKSIVKKAENDARRELMKARADVRKAQGKLAKATKIREVKEKTTEQDEVAPVPRRPDALTSDPAAEPTAALSAADAPAAPHASAAPDTAAPAVGPPPQVAKPDVAKPSDSAANQGAA